MKNNEEDSHDIKPCPVCGEYFDNIFEAVDHLLEDYEEPFDPKLILPNGYTLMVGSLLRNLYANANYPERIKTVVQSTYATLYAAETNPDDMRDIIEDMVVYEQMEGIDEEIKKLLGKKKGKE